ncbi:hypothetical protein [Streptomyces sp. NBC_01198]|uniref:hypothetical protein n=1 Tax=Streptomyces sp. NBC_01198 TaxID=2903769 RepID=UPI002E109FBA|nr:hypothetical protein OG702_19715 [Streptomyces sp. NBC_01198]
MTTTVGGDLELTDPRDFCLVDVGHGHAYAVLRGYPPVDEDGDAGPAGPVMDVVFAGVERISCWSDVGPIRVRRADESERQRIADGLGGKIRRSSAVFLLEDGSIASYVIASRVYWAEFDLPYDAVSPLASEDAAYREDNPPVGGVIRFAD